MPRIPAMLVRRSRSAHFQNYDVPTGATENARMENAGASNLKGWKSRELKSRHVRVNFLVSCQTLHSKSTRCAKQASIITRFSVNSQKHIFKTFAFHTFPPEISSLAFWCRDFHFRVFHSRDFQRPLPTEYDVDLSSRTSCRNIHNCQMQ